MIAKYAYLGYDAEQKAKERQASRDADEQALASGQKSREELRRENGFFPARRFRVDLSSAKSFV